MNREPGMLQLYELSSSALVPLRRLHHQNNMSSIPQRTRPRDAGAGMTSHSREHPPTSRRSPYHRVFSTHTHRARRSHRADTTPPGNEVAKEATGGMRAGASGTSRTPVCRCAEKGVPKGAT